MLANNVHPSNQFKHPNDKFSQKKSHGGDIPSSHGLQISAIMANLALDMRHEGGSNSPKQRYWDVKQCVLSLVRVLIG